MGFIKKLRWTRRGKVLIKLIKVYLYFLIFIFLITFITVILYKTKVQKEPQEKIIKPIKRSELYKRGIEIINYVWEYNSYRNGNDEKSDIKLPSYLLGKTTLKSSGIPYCWGGYLSLDKSNTPDAQNFQDAINKGFTAGNVFCSGEYKNFTAGLDCSGFVSAVYNLDEKCATYTLRDYFYQIDIKEIKPMDIYNSEKNHTFIYLKESWDKKGVITMESASGNGRNDKTIIGYRSYDEIKKGINGQIYIPMRYKGIIEDDIIMFKDTNEYNDNLEHAAPAQNIIRGCIEYADDFDYFRINNKNKKAVINVIKIPQFCRAAVLDDRGSLIAELKTGNNLINFDKGIIYIKIYGIDFKYGNDEYEIQLN